MWLDEVQKLDLPSQFLTVIYDTPHGKVTIIDDCQ